MTPRIRKLLVAFAAVLPVAVILLFWLPANSQLGKLKSEKAALTGTVVSSKQMLSLAEKEGASASIKGREVVVSSSDYQVLFRVAQVASDNGFAPYTWQGQQMSLRQE